MKQVADHQVQLEKVRENYTYNSVQTVEDIDANGKVTKTEAEEYNDFFVNGHLIERMVKKNGQPLTASEEQKETERVTKLVDKAGKIPPGQPLEGDTVSVSRLLEIMDVRNPRREVGPRTRAGRRSAGWSRPARSATLGRGSRVRSGCQWRGTRPRAWDARAAPKAWPQRRSARCRPADGTERHGARAVGEDPSDDGSARARVGDGADGLAEAHARVGAAWDSQPAAAHAGDGGLQTRAARGFRSPPATVPAWPVHDGVDRDTLARRQLHARRQQAVFGRRAGSGCRPGHRRGRLPASLRRAGPAPSPARSRRGRASRARRPARRRPAHHDERHRQGAATSARRPELDW